MISNANKSEGIKLRSHWDNEKNQWLFSLIDVVEILTDSTIPKRYWSDLKLKLQKESGETYENIVRLKLEASDGKLRETDAADTETILRIIQSIPSPKAEPFKQWLAKVGYERMKANDGPELFPQSSIEYLQKSGQSEKRNEQRANGLEALNKLAGYWKPGIDQKSAGTDLFNNTIPQDWGED